MKTATRTAHVTAVATAVILACVLAGCAPSTVNGGGSGPGGSGPGGSGPGGSSTTSSIAGLWQLISGTDAKGALTPGSATVTLRLSGDTSGGQGPCNAYGAKASTSTTGPITIVMGIRTEMACVEPELNTTEARYFAALGRIKAASISAGHLSLTGGGDTLLFEKSTK